MFAALSSARAARAVVKWGSYETYIKTKITKGHDNIIIFTYLLEIRLQNFKSMLHAHHHGEFEELLAKEDHQKPRYDEK